MPTCTAISLHTKLPCASPATSSNTLFCAPHAHECHLLYLSYKRSQLAYETLCSTPPPKSFPKKNYATTDWSSYTSLAQLEESHHYLLEKYKHLTRCILGRDLHHTHFYKDTSDFGHQKYLDGLRQQREEVDGALRRLELRACQLRNAKERWTKWVRSYQASVDARDEEARKKVREEAVGYKEGMERMEEMRRVEWERGREEREKSEVWDPIEEVIRVHRVGYLALVRLLLEREAQGVEEEEQALRRARELQRLVEGAAVGKKEREEALERKRMVLEEGRCKEGMVIRPIRMDLKQGAKQITGKEAFEMTDLKDEMMKDVIKSLNELFALERGASTYDLEEREQSLENLKKNSRGVREYLFLRLIAKNPTLLEVALKKDSIEDFLADDLAVRNSDLRELAFQLSKPSIIQVRHAFSDYWFSQNEGEVDKNSKQHKERVQLCGKWIHNFPEQAQLPRRGWFLFALLSEIPLNKARELCNSWDELKELDLLLSQNYFAGLQNKGWEVAGDFMFSTMRRMGYHHVHQQLGVDASQHATKKGEHALISRTVFHGIMGRNDPATRRFISFVKSAPALLNIYAHDMHLNKIITQPPKSEQWILKLRSPKIPKNRDPDDPKNYTIAQPFDEKFRQAMRSKRDWKPAFTDYIEIFVWDRTCSCQTPFELFMTKFLMFLHKANKFYDYMSVIEPALQVYRKCALEEEGRKSARLKHIQNLEDQIAELRRNRTEEELRVGNPEDYYNSTDAEIDRQFGLYDNDEYWIENDPNHKIVGAIPTLRVYAKLMNEGKVKEANNLIKRHPKKQIMPKYKSSELDRMHELAEKDDAIDEFWADCDLEADELVEWSSETADMVLEDNPRAAPHNVLVASNMVNILGKIDPEGAKKAGVDIDACNSLTNYTYRASHPPNRRPGRATPEIYAHFDKFLADHDLDLLKPEHKYAVLNADVSPLPQGWSRAILLAVARLADDDAIEPSADQHAYPTFAAPAPSYRGLKFYIDYRWATRWDLLDRPDDDIARLSPDPLYLKHEFEKVALAYPSPSTRYSLILLASSETHWDPPLYAADAAATVFADPLGRRWKWKKTPKDFPGFESDLAQIFKDWCTDGGVKQNTRVHVDRVLCWGRDLKECLEVSHKVCVLLNKPNKGKIRVDWGKVWVGRTREEMEGLGERWWQF